MELIRPASTAKEKAWILFLYFIPGMALTIALFTMARALTSFLGFSLWFTQILIVLVFLFVLQLFFVYLNARYLDGLSLASIVEGLGLKRFSFVNILLAVAYGIVSLILLNVYVSHVGRHIYSFLQTIPWLSMPEWHFQVCAKPEYSSFEMVLLLMAMLGMNVFCEEVFFRGYLFRKSAFLGRATWIVNGLFFIAYHLFQVPLTYAIFPVGLMISGYFAWRKDIYGAMIIHLMINVFLPSLH